MSERPLYHDGMRTLQDAFDSRRIADRLETVTVRTVLDEGHREFFARLSFFFLATADAEGWPDCSYKGGPPGFVRVLDDRTLAFPSYDGNGMFRSLGNIRVNPKVGLLFIDFARQRRVRVNGTATAAPDDALLADFPGAQLLVRVQIERVFPNCPRYIPQMEQVAASPYGPVAGQVAPVPDWKLRADFNDALPASDPARDPTLGAPQPSASEDATD